jgi:methyl-galactoside transport system ATP-binding protein
MEEILRISDFVTVMRDGKYIATEPAEKLTTEKIIKLMVGRELSERYPKKNNEPQGELLRVENLSAAYSALSEVSFTLRRGEILGVAGLDGAGRTELLESIFGLAERREGEIYLEGEVIKNSGPAEAIKNGFALLTEDRRASGIFGILPIRENMSISSLSKYKWGPLISLAKMRAAVSEYMKKIKIKAPSEETKIRSLSGGNQQKVIFSRWLLTDPKILLLDEPTRGIDVLAKYEIYKLIIALAEEGRGVILVSSEMPELMGLCDRILVMSGGRVAGEVTPDCSQEDIMRLATKNI